MGFRYEADAIMAEIEILIFLFEKDRGKANALADSRVGMRRLGLDDTLT